MKTRNKKKKKKKRSRNRTNQPIDRTIAKVSPDIYHREHNTTGGGGERYANRSFFARKTNGGNSDPGAGGGGGWGQRIDSAVVSCIFARFAARNYSNYFDSAYGGPL